MTKPCTKITTFVGFKDVWEEHHANIQIDLSNKLGSGNFGEVYKGKWRNKYDVAIKTLKLTEQDSAAKKELRKKEFLKECDIMKKFRHDKLVKLWCVCTLEEPVYIVTEYMCNGSLLKYLRETMSEYMRDLKGKLLNFSKIIDMAAQIACGMKYMEFSKCVHRDLAARNILVGERNIVKIADFGFAQELDENLMIDLSLNESELFPGIDKEYFKARFSADN